MSFFYVGRRRAGKSRAFVNVSVVLALVFSFLVVVLAVQTKPASAGGPVPRLVKLLGTNSYQDYNDSENRLDFVIAVPTGQTPTQIRIDQDPNGALANTLSLVAGPSVNNDYQIVSTTTIGAVDYLAISIRSDDNFNYADSCTVHSLTFAVRVTVPAGVINFNEPVTQYPTNPLCIGTGRPVARTTWDNAWGSPDGNSQDGFGAVIPGGVLSGTKIIIDADNPNFQNAVGQADCGVTNSVYYQWVKPDGSPTLLTPAPVSVATTAHHFATGSSLQQAITAGFPSTFDFTADGPGYYRLLAWPQATSVPAGVGCVGRSWDQTQISQGWQVGSVWYNFTVTRPAPPVITAPVNGSFTSNTTPTVTGTGTAGDTVTVTEGATTLCTAVVTAGGAWSCASSALTNGLHTIRALQTDADGIDSNPSANDAFTVDTVAPLAPAITAPANGSSTNNPSPNINGTGEPFATVTVKDEGGATVCTATVLAGGTWQCTPAASFSLGAHTVTASQIDRAGNLSPNSITNAFTVTTPVFTQTKTADRASYIVGQPITYTVTVNNAGTGPGTATVADTVPATVGSVSVTCSATGAGTCNTTGSSGNTVAGAVNLGVGESAVYTISGTVLSVGAVNNSATVTPTTATCTGQCGGGVASTPATTASGGPFFTQTKTADHASYITGQAIVYTVTVSNTGTGAGTASVADSVPATVGSVSVTCSATGAGTCNTTGSTGNSVVGSVNLPAGTTATYTVSGTVTAAGAVGNSATVTPTSVGCVGQCGGGTAATPATTASANPVFSQTKTADRGSYIIGQAISYTVTVTNSGTGAGTANVADTVPATVGSVSVTCSATGAGACNTVGSAGNAVAGAVNLPAGTTATYTISGTVISAGSVANSASVTPTTPGCTAQCGGGSTSTPPTTAVGNPVFTQTKTADHASYITGQAIVYTITVTNTGTGAGAAAVTDAVPSTVGMVTVSCSTTGGGSCDTAGSSGNAIAGSVNLPPSAVATYVVRGVVRSVGSVGNSVTVGATTPGCTTQCGGGSTSTTPITAVGNPVFTQTKTADKSSYLVGDPVTWTILVTNTGTGPGTANISDNVPSTVTGVSVSCSATGTASCTTTGSAGNTVSGFVSIPAGGQVVYTVVGTTSANGDVTNAVTTTPTTPGCTSQCGGGTASTPKTSITPTAHETLTKKVDAAGPFTIGENVPFSVTISNHGPSTATNVKVADVPTGLTPVSATPEVGSYDPVTGIWTIPVLKSGQTFTLHLVQRVTASHPVNKAVVLDPGASDPAIGNQGGLNCAAPSNGCVAVALAVAPAPSPPLAFTGIQIVGAAVAVIGLLVGGLLFLLLAGRRRKEQE